MKSFRLALCVAILIFGVLSANAQSTDQDRPTMITSDVTTGNITPGMKGTTYYYAFYASPGDLTVTLTIANSGGILAPGVQMGFTLLDEKEAQLTNYKYATSGVSDQAIANVKLSRRQRILLVLVVSDFSNGEGNYRVKISGPLEKGTGGGIDFSDVLNSDKSSSTNCLPKKGTLIVKMKDGSKKIVDLAEAETVTVVP